MSYLTSTNPAKGYSEVGKVEISSEQEIKQKVEAAQGAKQEWKALGAAGRVKILEPFYKLVSDNKEELALLATQEMGKAITEARGDIDWDLDYVRWYLDNAEQSLAEEITHEDDTAIHKVLYEPIGVAAVITPWNYPFGMFLWGMLPNLLAGNPVVAKVSEECPLMGKYLEEMIQKLDLPAGVFAQIHGDGEVGWQLANQDVDLIWFTGSSAVGKKLYELGGQKFVKVLLELGGSNPTIVFDDVDTDAIAAALCAKRFQNCGQSCDAMKRLLVHEKIFDDVTEIMKVHAEQLIVGDPEDPQTTMGPLVAERQLLTLEEQVQDALDKGATVVTGGKRPDGLDGAFYMPTILTGVTKDMRVWYEEVFGPVLPIVSFSTEEEAVELAEDTQYGLGAQVYSNDKERAERVASQLTVGNIDINQTSHWIPCNPFGGCKASGMGMEHGKYGFHELSQMKQISMEK